MSVIALDPGESTGWCFEDDSGVLHGGTCPKDHMKVAELLEELNPDIYVVESFKLYPQKAKSLSWNSFYPCEVIGVIKYLAMRDHKRLIEQAPSIKKYAGGFKEDWDQLKQISTNVTEHTKDAYQHLKYYKRFNKNK